MTDRVTYRRIAVFFMGFLALWIAAWLVARLWGWSNATTYWVIAKATVWVVYPLLVWRYWQTPLSEQLRFIGLDTKTLRQGFIWAILASALWTALSAVVAPLRGQHMALTPLSVSMLYTLILSPMYEEWLFRGYIQSALIQRSGRFWLANFATSLLFLTPHFIGWDFQGVLAANAFSLYPFTILLVSLVLGYVRRRSGSLLASLLLHISNDAFSLWCR